jgi:protease II
MMKATEKFQQNLYKELLGRIKETDLSVPVKEDDYYYYSRTEKGKQYHINCRKKENLQAKEAGASGRYDYLKEIAFEYAFIFGRLGIHE